MNAAIRQEVYGDHAAVHQLLADAFSQEDEARLVDQLRNDPWYVDDLSLVAEVDDRIVGYILFTKLAIVNKNQRFLSLALAPLAVSPAYQRSGVGGQLVREGHKRAIWLGYDSVIVLGDHTYYSQFGYKPARQWNIQCPFNAPEEDFMARELIMGSLRGVSGMAEYAKPFR